MLLRTRSIGGLKIHFRERRGGRSCVLLIHGNSSCGDVFSPQAAELSSKNFSFVIPDLPGHGRSDNADSPAKIYSFPGYAKILRLLMHELGYATFHVVGWSLGGHIGLEMWAHQPAVRSLLISGTPPVRLNPDGVARGFRWTPTTRLAGRKHFSSEETRRYVQAMMGRFLPPHHRLSKAAARTDGNARLWMVKNGLSGIGVDEENAVAEIDRPLAIVQGRADPFLHIGHFAQLQFRNIWTGQPVFLDAGHAAHWQRPHQFNQHMISFFNHVN